MSVEFDEISKMRENADDTTSKFLHLFSYRNLKVASFWSRVFCLISLEKYIFFFNPFTSEFMKWTLPSPDLIISIVSNRGFSQKSITANSAYPAKTSL